MKDEQENESQSYSSIMFLLSFFLSFLFWPLSPL